jgi:hypothetical protein
VTTLDTRNNKEGIPPSCCMPSPKEIDLNFYVFLYSTVIYFFQNHLDCSATLPLSKVKIKDF